MLLATLTLAMLQSWSKLDDLLIRTDIENLLFTRSIIFLQMVTGAMLVYYLTMRNRRYGIGGQTLFILVNIMESILSAVRGHTAPELYIPFIAGILLILLGLVMENAEFRIPMQRISIHNIYADQNYVAIKLNPVGMMPAMFASVFFTIPQIVVRLLLRSAPYSRVLNWLYA